MGIGKMLLNMWKQEIQKVNLIYNSESLFYLLLTMNVSQNAKNTTVLDLSQGQ